MLSSRHWIQISPLWVIASPHWAQVISIVLPPPVLVRLAPVPAGTRVTGLPAGGSCGEAASAGSGMPRGAQPLDIVVDPRGTTTYCGVVDPIVLIGAFAALGLSIGSCLVGYAIISRWPTSPRQLADRIEGCEHSMQALHDAWAAHLTEWEGVADRLNNNAERVKKQQDRREKSQERQPVDSLEAQMAALGPGGVMSRLGRN